MKIIILLSLLSMHAFLCSMDSRKEIIPLLGNSGNPRAALVGSDAMDSSILPLGEVKIEMDANILNERKQEAICTRKGSLKKCCALSACLCSGLIGFGSLSAIISIKDGDGLLPSFMYPFFGVSFLASFCLCGCSCAYIQSAMKREDMEDDDEYREAVREAMW